VKGAIVQIDATPFKQWYEKHYGTTLGKKKKVSILLLLPLIHNDLTQFTRTFHSFQRLIV
jgi:hypothetical protein